MPFITPNKRPQLGHLGWHLVNDSSMQSAQNEWPQASFFGRVIGHMQMTQSSSASTSASSSSSSSSSSSLYSLQIQARNNSPAVARVSRPYSWCTLATCVHDCPSMMFRTCCCLCPKCKRSYLLIYITSDTS